MTCSRVPQLVDALLSIKIGVGKTLHSCASRYWELYNEISGGNERIAASTFRMGLPENSKLRESLTKRPPEDTRQLMRHIEEYKRLEDDRLQSKGKASLVNRSRPRVFPSRPRRDLRVQEPEVQKGEVNVAFREPVHKIVDRIKNEPFFRWPNKMGGDPSRRNQNLYCTYHRDKRTYNRAMPSVERPSGVASESGTFEGVCVGIRESWCQARGSIKREPSPATLRGDQGHPCRAEGYEYS